MCSKSLERNNFFPAYDIIISFHYSASKITIAIVNNILNNKLQLKKKNKSIFVKFQLLNFSFEENIIMCKRLKRLQRKSVKVPISIIKVY